MEISILNKQKVMVIIRHNRPFDLIALFETIINTGIKTIEITLNTIDSLKLINNAVKQFNSDIIIGAGTVLTMDELKQSIDCGAKYIVSPVFNKKLVEYCVNKKIPIFPGAVTPTEIYNAYQSGAYMVKIFPVSVYGPSYIKSIKAPLSNIKILAVGGINNLNANDYIANGSDAVAIGSGTIKPEWIDTKNYDAIKNNLSKLLNSIKINS